MLPRPGAGAPARRTRDRSYLFYGTRVSYFSAKVRCALLAKGVPFREIEPTRAVYRDVIQPRTGLAFNGPLRRSHEGEHSRPRRRARERGGDRPRLDPLECLPASLCQ
jgi:hypothetical protein